MKLKEYYEVLKRMVEETPEVLELEVVYSIDDEGNAFRECYCTPTPGMYVDMDFHTKESFDYENGEYVQNAICIN